MTSNELPQVVGLPTVDELMPRLGIDDPLFSAWRNSIPDKHWTRLDLSALRIGYELGRAAALSTLAAQGGEVVYQCMCTDEDHIRNGPKDIWMDVDRASYEKLRLRDDVRSRVLYTTPPAPSSSAVEGLTFGAFREANVARCVKWHPEGIASWSPSDWLTAVTGELGELASLLKMRNRERDGLPGNKFSPTDKMIADELADVLTYLDLLAEVLGVDLGRAAVEKFNEVSERVGFPDRISTKELT